MQHREMMQAFVSVSFNRTTSTDAALRLLRHLKSVLQRDSLKTDLVRMYKVHISPRHCHAASSFTSVSAIVRVGNK